MGYRSQIALKTTTEGYLIMKQMNDAIETKEDRPLDYMEIQKTTFGFYKISQDDLKWYDSYPDVQNFNKMLEKLEAEDIPYSFIRIGEESDDVEHKCNYTDDMPDEISSFEPIVDINDEDYDSYYEDV